MLLRNRMHLLIGVSLVLLWTHYAHAEAPTSAAIDTDGMALLHKQIVAAAAAAPDKAMASSGLAAVQGGARFKLRAPGPHEVLLPLPQLAAGQAPVAYAITANPSEAVEQYRIEERDRLNHVVRVKIAGAVGDEVQLAWSSVVLIDKRITAGGRPDAEPYKHASPCVQANDARIAELAEKTWPSSGEPQEFASGIQGFIRGMSQRRHPRSLDALGILDSGANWICTANANLAAALLRAKGVPARSLAVIPLTSQRLEMHRTVAYHAGGEWVEFDPSSLHKAIPMGPWCGVVMANTTPADERAAMRPRMGIALGVPYGQSGEVSGPGVQPWGQDFFWTLGKPLAEFPPTAEDIRLVKQAWRRYLKTGTSAEAQAQAALARDAEAFASALRHPAE